MIVTAETRNLEHDLVINVDMYAGQLDELMSKITKQQLEYEIRLYLFNIINADK